MHQKIEQKPETYKILITNTCFMKHPYDSKIVILFVKNNVWRVSYQLASHLIEHGKAELWG